MKSKALTFAALEVGTQSLRDVFDALRRDNWLHVPYLSMEHRNAKAIKKRDLRGLLSGHAGMETQSLEKRGHSRCQRAHRTGMIANWHVIHSLKSQGENHAASQILGLLSAATIVPHGCGACAGS